MSTFICEKCGCIDNTACYGNYWVRNSKEDILCSECYSGQWHTHFSKRHWSDVGDKKEILKKSNKNDGTLINAKEYFEKTKE
ncbi:hypothetical protein DVV91_10185 [Clostridium botulinum]|uniref:hypothetical protein n=1 Tax=Clostridium botulinum TaxID=1491 RepID=UPI0019670B45|nr:hypothetical protein [Clostridium botulinum]MBN1074710.1 hypothetical protein [Clostridium botulinum]